MANFGARLAYPDPRAARRAETPAPAARADARRDAPGTRSPRLVTWLRRRLRGAARSVRARQADAVWTHLAAALSLDGTAGRPPASHV